MEQTIRQLEREKTEGVLCKVALEKQLNDVKKLLKACETYRDGYEQLKADYDQLQADYCDVIVDRDNLQASASALAAVIYASGFSQPVKTEFHTSTLQSIDDNLEVQQVFWKRQEDLAEIARRKKLEEMEEADWVLEARNKQIQELEKSKDSSNSKPDDSGHGKKQGGDTGTSQPSTQQDRLFNMAPIQHDLEQQRPTASQADYQPHQSKGAHSERTTWAKKNADGKPDSRHQYVHATNQGAGVTTVRKKDEKSRHGAARDH